MALEEITRFARWNTESSPSSQLHLYAELYAVRCQISRTPGESSKTLRLLPKATLNPALVMHRKVGAIYSRSVDEECKTLEK
ncbi:hypothetical protein KEM48_007659 [Puccinia striiformis f. sp. tritici PST-130]|nr:hypothetical protein KEM48_007659 [Puccinia striiformis f. sp. tritici PST-130]